MGVIMHLDKIAGGGGSSHPATADELGIVKPDGITTQVDENGVLSTVSPQEDTAAIEDTEYILTEPQKKKPLSALWTWIKSKIDNDGYLTEHQSLDDYAKTENVITNVQMNGANVTKTNGTVNLGAVLTTHQDISGKVDKSGDTMTGLLRVNHQIFGYAYNKANNIPAFIFDKPGSNYTGIGANGTNDEIQFGPCNTDGNGIFQWQSTPIQNWRFKGNTKHDGHIVLTETNNILLRPQNGSYTAGIGYDTNGNECISLWAKNTVTRLRWYAGKDMTTLSSGSMMNITPDFEVSKASGSAIGYIAGSKIMTSANFSLSGTTLTITN